MFTYGVLSYDSSYLLLPSFATAYSFPIISYILSDMDSGSFDIGFVGCVCARV